MADLTAEQTEQLTCFQEITQTDSIDECRQILEAFSWNIESAIQNSFNEVETLQPTQTPPQTPIQPQTHQPLPNIQIHTQSRTLSYHSSTQPPQTFFQWSLFLVSFPFKLIFSTLTEIATSFISFFTNQNQNQQNTLTNYDPLENITQFTENYNSTYSSDHVTFFHGSYSQAVNEAKRQLKFLVVYVHDNENQDCKEFASNTMSNTDLIQFLESNVVFWACSIDLPEGKKVHGALRARRCPFIGVIVYKHARMTLVSKIEGPVSAAELLLQLAQLFNENEAELVVARRDKEEVCETRMIRDQQDVAYEQSLLIDREKERVKRQVIEERVRAERVEKERLVNLARNESEIQEKRILFRSLLLAQPEPDSSLPTSIKLLIKLPTGTRHQRVFNKHTEPICNLYKFVLSHEDCPNRFEIAINFPHKVIECNEFSSERSIEQAGITQSMLLFVNDLDA